ncbi:MAG: deoxyribose-phosphate aldolase [Candidatus Magasanikbacteria bacterium CG10_big_fil_rev_8_21_14_0_10_36_32]|uniref:Deoxyribose-phosphate aldolase n=1 Tax=Candidatus Magasanikbacteria bacterium CG10_big_fil_rev_8_21_14_0_10_36_32 TaxID=1974646 RepID=A0A2M6W612_9BACT|nr:MAG: deoxyribose-phosphate aldolase [Candidatus Magasanikbacteria bacterium CG10_big_fil_rev_8_21_14_0_10_36_32]
MDNFAKYIDHTLLKADANETQIRQLCAEAKEYNFASVCVNSIWTEFCAELLSDTDVKVCVVVGFPLGATLSEVKSIETKLAIEHGAQEVDMVINIGALKDGKNDFVRDDIKAVVETARGKALVKVIIENAYLTNEQKVKACQLCKEAGADFVKTSTGFGPSGATVEDVKLMRHTVGEEMGVKAAGGIKTLKDALSMVEAGANRLGCSAGMAIIKEMKE